MALKYVTIFFYIFAKQLNNPHDLKKNSVIRQFGLTCQYLQENFFKNILTPIRGITNKFGVDGVVECSDSRIISHVMI